MYSFIIHSWMMTDLKLSGNDLIIYANIYQFSNLPGNYFTASLSTISKTLNISLNTVQRCLKKLVENGLVTKQEMIVNKVTVCRYAANLSMLSTETQEGIAKMDRGYSQNGSQYNIINNNTNNTDNNTSNKTNISSNQGIRRGKLFGDDKSGEKKAQKVARMSKMLDAFMLSNFNNSSKIKEALKTYLGLRVKKGLEPEQWAIILDSLKYYENDYSVDEIVADINTCISGGYMVLVPEWKLKKKSTRVDNIKDSVPDNLDHQKSGRAF